jgi:hypothetical protein
LDGSDVSVLFSDVAGTSAITTNGQTIRCWKDKSGRGCNATQAGNAPIWNSSNYVNFTQSLGQFMNLPNGTLPFASGTNAYSIFAVANLNNTSGGLKTIIGNGSAGTNSFNALQIQAQSIANLWYNNDVAGGSLTANTFFIANIAFDGSTRYIYQNGTSVNTTASSGWAAPNTNNVIGVEPATGNWYYDGNIGEILVYNTALTTAQRQQVEGYLAHKWGLTGYYSPNTPLSISGCQLWFDAADPLGTGIPPNSGTTITSWKDKSGNANNATGQVSAVVTSDSTGSYLNFTGSNSYTIGSGDFIANQYYTIFIVETLQSPSFKHLIGNGILGPNNAALHIRYDSPTILRFASFNNDLDVNIPAFTTAAAQPTRILTFSQLPSSRTVYINSTSFGSDTNNTLLSAWAQPLIGQSFGQGYYTGKMREIIFYTGQLTTTQRQTIEGYLARKWGLTSMYGALPSIHPFYSIRPHLRAFNPTDIDGCALWLDGADRGSMTFSGSTITQWNDKSGNGKNATISSGRIGATFSSALNCVYFQSASVGYQTSYLANPTNETMFIVANVDSPSSEYNNTLICGQQGARSLGVGWNGGRDATTCAYLNSHVSWRVSTPSGSYTAGTTALITGQVSSGTSLSIAMNGATFSTGSEGGFYANTTTHLGVDTTTTGYYYNGFVMEILFYNSVFTTSQRQQVEGYLAHKWGLTTPIPSTHPFKSFPSATVPLKPVAIETVSLTSLTTSNGVINWTITNATGYTWYVGTGSGSGQLATGTITSGSTLTAAVTYAFVIGNTYYAWVIPYNLDGLGPTTISSPVTFTAGFSPTSITGLQLWLDGNDPAGTGTQPANGATVSTWVDKSGNGYNATAAPSRVVGTYSTSFRAVNFATSSTGYITSYSAAPTNETMFVVFNNPSPSGNNNILIGGVQGARSLGAGHSSAGTGTVGNLNTQVAWLATTGTYTGGTTVLTTSQFTTSTNTISLNGGTAASGGPPGFTAGRVTYLGVDASSASYYYVGYGMEILFYNSVLSTNDRQKVEGYLAHKWGIQSSLPAGHPYKLAAP